MVHAALSYLREGRSPARTRVDISNLLETVTDQFADMGYTVGFAGPAQVVALADPDALHRAVTNLVQNAVRFADRTRVDLEADGAQVIIAVVDDGPGIAVADMERLMEPFARGDEARSQNESTGFGLGLPIAKTIAESHGGTLALMARRPHGLEARLTIPQC
jgi:signal transduction histidine kinase